MSNQSSGPLVYVGTYTQALPHVNGTAEGVYVYRLDPGTGALHRQSVGSGVINPSFVTLDAQRRFLYAVQEVGEHEGQDGGAVSAFAVDPATGDLTLINTRPTHGAHPCYVSIDNGGRWLLVANYSGGSAAVLPIGADGSLGPATEVVRHDGPHPHHDGPHPHAAVPAPEEDFVLVPDCGLDRLYVYRLDTASGKLAPHATPWVTLAPGAGPRHLAFDAAGARVYCINERNSTMTTFAYDRGRGELRELQTLPTLPDGFDGRNSCADVHIHPSGRFVYGSNRGHDSIVAFAVDAESGQLALVGHTSTGGRTPRNFAIDPTGAYLLAANQDTNTVVTFRIDQESGVLEETGLVAEVPSPVCVHVVGAR
jgi:6-phosphogluconolactonase